MSNVLIVGFGNIGQRHFQSLCVDKKISKIFLYDINKKKIKKYFEINKKFKKKIIILSTLKLKKKVDLCILATTSNVRYRLLLKVIKNINVKNFILEKIVFQNVIQYEKTRNILDKNKKNCWINYPRRTWKVFKDLKKKISKKHNLEIIINGYNWGMISNSLHFIELYQFLSNNYNDLSLSMNGIQKKIFKSKRPGFYEFYGKITGKSHRGDKFVIQDIKKFRDLGIEFKLKQNNKTFIFNQSSKMNRSKIPLQSKETLRHFRSIKKNNKCSLPTYEETYSMHINFFKVFFKFIKNHFPKNYKVIKIT